MRERWVLEKDFRFEAAHKLPHHDGKCARLHGHSWKGTVRVSGEKLQSGGPKDAMIIDFGEIKKFVEALIEEKLDHHYLNETLAPIVTIPTSEKVAWWLYLSLEKLMRGTKLPETVKLESVTIEETCTSRCTYSETDGAP